MQRYYWGRAPTDVSLGLQNARWMAGVCVHQGPSAAAWISPCLRTRPCELPAAASAAGERVLLSFCSHRGHVCSVESSFKAVLWGNRGFSCLWNSLFLEGKPSWPVAYLGRSVAAASCLPTPPWQCPASFSSEKLSSGWSYGKSSCLRQRRVYPIPRWSWSNPLLRRYLYGNYICYSSAYVRNAYVIPHVNS